METLRERDTALLRTPTDRDKIVNNGSNGRSHDQNRQNADFSSSFASHSASTPAYDNGETPAAATENRFARNFTDPLFPCKPVRYAAAKRGLDLTVASLVLLALLPVMIVIAAIIKLTSKGPIVFKQIRVGEGGRHFWCYKFRSMCADAEAKKQELMHLNEASGPVFKIKSDPRITPIGGFIRKTSLDELPQLFNVLKGEMSLVGPRPPIPSEVALYGPRERGRLAVKPGLTCLWQVGGRSNISFEHWVELDLLYIDTMTFGEDLKILVRTIPAVVKGSGAH